MHGSAESTRDAPTLVSLVKMGLIQLNTRKAALLWCRSSLAMARHKFGAGSNAHVREAATTSKANC